MADNQEVTSNGYEILRSDGTRLTIRKGLIDDDQMSIPLIGQNSSPYGPSAAKAWVWVLENFASKDAPENAIPGQCWYNKETKRLHYNIATDDEENGSPAQWEEILTVKGKIEGDLGSKDDPYADVIYARHFFAVGDTDEPDDPGSNGMFFGTATHAESAQKWETPRTITLTGAISGSTTLDGSENVSLEATIVQGNYPPKYTVVEENTTVEANQGYLVNTSEDSKTITLPTTPDEGDWISIGDYDGSCSEEKTITIASANPIHGINDDLILSNPNIMVSLSYINAIQGWRITDGIGETRVEEEDPTVELTYPPIYDIVNANTTASVKKGYLVNTSEGSKTITLPNTPSQGDWILLGDYDGSCSEENLIIITSDNPIHGSTDDLTLSSRNVMITLTYIDATQGWKVTDGIGETNGETSQSNNSSASTRDYVVNSSIGENFHSDKSYEFGTVVKLGGKHEITETNEDSDYDVFGVISESPNNAKEGTNETHPYVALSGRVPVKVTGLVKKGQRLVSSAKAGIARAITKEEMGDITSFQIIGRAIEDKKTKKIGTIMVVVGS